MYSRQKKPKQGSQRLVVRVMAVLLALVFLLSLSSQIVFYVGAEDLGDSAELKARHTQLSRQHDQVREELETLSEQECSAADRYELTARLEELVGEQIRADQQLLEFYQRQCKCLGSALEELLNAVKDQEVVLECGQEELEQRISQVQEQLDEAKGRRQEIQTRLEEEESEQKSLEKGLSEVIAELDTACAEDERECEKIAQSLEDDILAEETEEAVKRSPFRIPEFAESFLRGKSREEKKLAPEDTTGADVVKFAVQFVGMPYKWGGESLTEGCDCSGFIKGVFANFQVDLPHFSGSLQHSGTPVEYEDAQLGDLICYDGHVGIYMGEGKMVNAFDSKHGIIICSVNVARLVTVRRII